MILARGPRFKQCHETIAEELIDPPLVAVHEGEKEFEETVHQPMHLLRAQPFRQARETDDIAE